MARILWYSSEDRIKQSNMFKFIGFVNRRFSLAIQEYDELYHWSVRNISDFWAAFWDFAQIRCSSPFDCVVDDVGKMPGARWFEGARLNFAENLLRYRDDHSALIFKAEGRPSIRMTYRQLYDEVAGLVISLKALGLKPGDRVAGFMPNMPQTIIAMLAATSLGATWSSCSPDFGIKGVMDRFGQIAPKVLFTADGYFFKGKPVDCLERVADIVPQVPSLEKVVVVPYVNSKPDISGIPKAVRFDEFKTASTDTEVEFIQLPADHPLYIMYSSGTTGLPKCMVHGAAGVLINHLKELMLHTDVKREDVIFYYTTCGWMMWNWLTSALAVGATLVLYDGNPFYPDEGALWQMAQEEKITVFGTSAGYITALRNTGLIPKEKYDLAALRTLLSTGSPLSEEGFAFVYDAVKANIQLASIAGGTDLNGCFALGNPMGPVYMGKLQCRGLGMKVEAFDEDGRPVIGRQGELVCTAPFPSMPVCFWDDPEGAKYHGAYFDTYPGVWRHGDYIEINAHGGVKIYGRSDATLNPGGVRIGTAEIYRQVEQMEEIADSVVIGQDWKNDVRVILFVRMAPGFELTESLKQKIRQTIRVNASPRHVPAKIIAVPEIPYTLNMKKVELAVKNMVQNKPVLNKDALKNPEALDCYTGIAELRTD
ncbi:acetoacetate--CoA ligase [Desulfosudis oleivorans]|uniref:Acetoacetyl-CoA synthase n=1 Tax=Desulfosudis oleivorans (strain DSM 6200 / JCM 39069 / Hxd3) TaxID=96561 RepID=A9A014_DESOH|nr:acetoacetate--CoA ligase [Desulfosudis oleivorans]ABW67414.1 acetoacetyl-CoA synthase [Desulfosudis oleivorans Hxd3]